ncbi:MarR family winged helix-turn-helix transcriptional regulator [Candidatus Litorirhabdus singularis]|nr:MarR family transcriptional regulator [Candidatus Litorirhabdus singularis]
MTPSTNDTHLAYQLSNNLSRLLLEFGRDYERRILKVLHQRGHADVRPCHSAVFSNLGLGAVRVTELAERAQITQQAMGKILKELERLGYVARDIDGNDRRAKKIRLTERGREMVRDSMNVVLEVRKEYALKAGEDQLEALESQLARCVDSIELEYLPESWANLSKSP